MTDEHMMRLWADAHHGFSADLDRGILKLDRFLRSPARPAAPIGRAYAPRETANGEAKSEMSATARAALAGMTACFATMGLLVTVALLATADVHPAAAHPILAHTIVA
jgi:hypothetical protein